MAAPKPPKKKQDNVDVEPGAEKRLAEILRKALNTPGSRHGNESKRDKPAKPK